MLDLIKQLEETRGNAQLELLRQNDSKLLRKILTYTYDPFKVYGIKAVELRQEEPGGHMEKFFKLLDLLSSRQLKGAKAKKAVEDMLAGAGEWQDICYKILMKDLKCGLKISRINQAFPGLLPDYDVQLAEVFDPKRVKFDPYVLVDIKRDGFRCTAFCYTHKPTLLLTRNGKPIKGYEHIKEQLRQVARSAGQDLEIDGELMVGMFGDRKAKQSSADFIAFDLIVEKVTQHERLDVLWQIIKTGNQRNIQCTEWQVASDLETIHKMYEEALAAGEEGIMIKDPKAFYVRKRSFAWMKYKPIKDIDLEIVGYYAGEPGKYEGGLGGFIVDYKGKHLRVPSGKGVTLEDHFKLWEIRDKCIGEILEIQYMEETPDGALRHPRFTKVRWDK